MELPKMLVNLPKCSSVLAHGFVILTIELVLLRQRHKNAAGHAAAPVLQVGASYASHRNINMSGCAVPNHTAKPWGARQKNPVRFLYRALNLPMKKPEKSKKYQQNYQQK